MISFNSVRNDKCMVVLNTTLGTHHDEKGCESGC